MLLVVPKVDELIQNRDGWIESGILVEKSLRLDQMLIKKLLFSMHCLALVSALCMAKWIVFLVYSRILLCRFFYVSCSQLCY